MSQQGWYCAICGYEDRERVKPAFCPLCKVDDGGDGLLRPIERQKRRAS